MIINSMQPTSLVLKRSKFHPYNLKILHKFTKDDPGRKLELCDRCKIEPLPKYLLSNRKS